MASMKAALLLLLGAGAHAQSITPAGCTNLVQNGGFEQDGESGGPGYYYRQPSSWTQTGRNVLIQQGNGPWGGLRSNVDSFYLGIQNRGSAVTQNVQGFQVGSLYTLRFLSAERPGSGTAERISVTIGGQPLLTNINPVTAFVPHQITFNATAATLALRFINAAAGGDSTVFIDDVSICAAPQACALVQNGDFEVDGHGAAFNYQVPTGWTRTGTGTVVALNGNGPWGGLNSGNGAYYLVLQGANTEVRQTLSLTQGVSYTLSFLSAERPGAGTAERLGVLVNNAFLPGANSINVYGIFTQYQFTFRAGATTTIAFRNTASGAGDHSVFIDAITVCANPPPPPPVTTTTATTTTRTQTTATPQLERNFNDTRRNLVALGARVATTEAAVARLPAAEAAIAQLQTSLTAALTRIGQLENLLSAATAALPPAPPPGPPPATSTGPSQIRADASGNVVIAAPGRAVQMESACGVINPCDLLNALNGLRQA